MKNIRLLSRVVLKESIRRKDFYVLFVVTAVITLVMGSVNLFHDNQIVRYLKEICLLLIWISTVVIAITMAARQIPAERESRTIFPLLAKPITRTEVLLGKFFGCWIAVAAALAVFYIFFRIDGDDERTSLAVDKLFSSHLAALGHAGCGYRNEPSWVVAF